MKQILLTFIAVLYTSAICAQRFNPTTQRDSILNEICEDVASIKFNQEEYDDMEDNGMRRYMENNDEEGWD